MAVLDVNLSALARLSSQHCGARKRYIEAPHYVTSSASEFHTSGLRDHHSEQLCLFVYLSSW